MTGGFDDAASPFEPSLRRTDPIEKPGTSHRNRRLDRIDTTDFVAPGSIPVVVAHRFEHEAPRVEPERHEVRLRILKKDLRLTPRSIQVGNIEADVSEHLKTLTAGRGRPGGRPPAATMAHWSTTRPLTCVLGTDRKT
jgi:hypothetical protein